MTPTTYLSFIATLFGIASMTCSNILDIEKNEERMGRAIKELYPHLRIEMETLNNNLCESKEDRQKNT